MTKTTPAIVTHLFCWLLEPESLGIFRTTGKDV